MKEVSKNSKAILTKNHLYQSLLSGKSLNQTKLTPVKSSKRRN
jgi:hypothetical protein